MGHPSSYYVKYLLAESWHDDDRETDHGMVCQTLMSFGLPVMTEEEYSFLQLSMRFPSEFSFANRRHKPSSYFMKQEGLFTLWKPNDDTKLVTSFLLRQQRARFKIDIMLMGGVPNAIIAKHLNKEFRFRDPLTKGMIDTYHFFFWNTDLPSLLEWQNMLYTHPQREALMASYYCGPDQAMYRIGGNPVIKDPKKPLREANRQAYWVLMALRHKPDTAEVISLRSRLTNDLRALHDAIHGEGADTDAQLKKFRQFLVEKVPSKVEEWDKVVNEEGSYSGDGKDYSDDDADA
jgi:hypothetical protein